MMMMMMMIVLACHHLSDLTRSQLQLCHKHLTGNVRLYSAVSKLVPISTDAKVSDSYANTQR